MMTFLFGIAFGALGMWAYHGGKLQTLMGGAPEPMQQAIKTATERINQSVNTDQVRKVASVVPDMVKPADPPQIVRPSAAEVATRPSEPLPRIEPEGVHVEQ